MNRREVLTGMALGGAAVALPAAAIARSAARPSQAAWDSALARYRIADATYDALIDRSDAAEHAAGLAQPRIDRYFDDYGLGMGMDRDSVVRRLHTYALCRNDAINVQATADEFMAYQQRHDELCQQFKTKELNQRCKEYLPVYERARDDLMRLPAPDTDALLVKMGIAAMSLADEHATLALADAHRLLAGRA